MAEESGMPEIVTPRLYLRKGHVKPTVHRHPWVFPASVARVEGPASSGEVVDVVDPSGAFLARGFYNEASHLRVRLWTWRDDEALDEALMAARLDAAQRLRRTLRLEARTDAFRLVHGEGDGMPGLVVDRLADTLVLQVSSLGLARRLPCILDLLRRSLPAPLAIYRRDDPTAREHEGMEAADGSVWKGGSPAEPLVVHEDGRAYEVDIWAGQKTGFYADQRDNRRLASELAPGLRVLDGFSYTGAFAIACASGGAREVVAVESATGPVEVARRNLERNGVSDRVTLVRDDIFRYLNSEGAKNPFDLVILDPPRYARGRSQLANALKKYEELNHLGLRAVAPGGLLLTCSCSQAVSDEAFEAILKEASRRARRPVRILERRGQPPDHPVSVFCPESRYLKAYLCEVG